ncbi:hypothetical protein FHS18_004249 [Paenibacillus phyllosphaerae]|uniref:Uncharacterized protein n=1 Tax=Paenibacillus phyllosphaerae TaxID=274593 RepID=A0A7W5B1J0_9BACL|nr:hypothetical protein [Paenibacillus phyllosphaerae]
MKDYRKNERRAERTAAEGKQSEQERAVDEELASLLRGPLAQWEEQIQPEVPALADLAQLVSSHRSQQRVRLWRDLLILWVIGGIVIACLLLLLEQNVVWFAIVQAIVLVGAVLFGVRFGGREREVRE